MNESNPSTQTYVLGYSAEETQRLQKQAQYLLPMTRRLLEEAGIAAGMKVLDVGSGAGDVALLVADLVGPTGMVVGVDSNPAILETARARVQAAGLTNVSFVVGDIAGLLPYAHFDALVGRLILFHLSDPATVLRQLVRHLRPGGIVAFQEPDFTHQGTSVPPSPLFEQIGSWTREMYRRIGLDYQIGLRSYRVFLDAGLPVPQIHCESIIGAGPDAAVYDLVARMIRKRLPAILKYGIATAEEVEIDTLAQRMRDEAVSQRLVTKGPDLFSAWTRTAPFHP